MTDHLSVSANEGGLIRLFEVDLPAEQIESFRDETAANGALDPFNAALGVDRLERAHVDLIETEALGALGLTGYLVEGLGADPEEVARDAARLNAVTGHVLIVLSAAFGGRPARLDPKAPLRWIGAYTEQSAPVRFEPLPSESAKGIISDPPQKAPKSQARISGMVAMYALLAMFALVALMVWVGR